MEKWKIDQKIGKLWILVCLSFLLTACASSYAPPAPVPHEPGSERPYEVNGIWYYPLSSAKGFVQKGIASWYGPGYEGKPTSCGEPYNMWALTAAHKTLPLGTYVKVTNLANGRSVVAEITDRGPFVPDRIIDLSAGCAKRLGCLRQGLARVLIKAVQPPGKPAKDNASRWKHAPAPSVRYDNFAVQIGAFRNETNAYLLQARMKGRDCRVWKEYLPDKNSFWYRVQVGAYNNLNIAKVEAERYRANGFPGAFVISAKSG